MLSIKKLLGRKPHDSKLQDNDNGELQQDTTRLNRRHSSAGSNTSTEDPEELVTIQSTTRSSGRFSVLSFRSPFKGRNSTSTCKSCQNSACTCPAEVTTANKQIDHRSSVQQQKNRTSSNTFPRLTSQSATDGAFPDENGNNSGDEAGVSSTTKMNGTPNHGFMASVSDEEEFVSSSRDYSPKLSETDKKIRNTKQNSSSSPVAGVDCGSSKVGTANYRSSVQGVPDSTAKPLSTATLPAGLQLGSSFSGGVSRTSAGVCNQSNGFPGQFYDFSGPSSCVSTSSSGLSSTSVGLQHTNPQYTSRKIDETTRLEITQDSSTGFSNQSFDLSSTSNGILQADTTVDRSEMLPCLDSSSGDSPSRSFNGTSSQTAGFLTSPSGLSSTDAPVPPPRRNRSRLSAVGRLCLEGDLPHGWTGRRLQGQQISRSTKARSLSELFRPASDEDESTGKASSLADELVPSKSSTLTSGILSDEFLPSASLSLSSSSSTASADVQADQSSSLTLSAAAASISHSEHYEPRSLGMNSALSASSSSSSTTTIVATTTAAATATTTNTDSVEVISSLANSAPSVPPLSTPATTSDHIEPGRTNVPQLSFSLPSALSSSDPAEWRPSSHGVGERPLPEASEPDGSEKQLSTHLRTREVAEHPVTSLRALRYSSNCVGENYGRSALRSPESCESTSPALVRMTGLTLGHVMTPPRVAMTTEKPAAAADHHHHDHHRLNPAIDITEAEISQLADDVTQADDNNSADHEINDERLYFSYDV